MYQVPIEVVIQKENFDVLKLLLENGSDIHQKNHEGLDPINIAVRSGSSPEMVQFLLENGADPNSRSDEHQNTPLHLAARDASALETVKLLVQHGADVKAQGQHSWTPFFVAISENLDIVKYLLDHGSDLMGRDSSQNTPLHFASAMGSIEIVKFLVESGADLNSTDIKNRTPLHLTAWEKESEDKIRYLLKMGADSSIASCNGKTPLYLTVEQGRKKNLEAMLELGVDFSCTQELVQNLGQNSTIDRVVAIDVLLRHLVRLRFLKLVDEEVYEMWRQASDSKHLMEFELICQEEVDKMSRLMICPGRRIHFGDLLREDVKRLAVYLNFDDVIKRIDETNLEEEFPNYAAMMRSKIAEAMLEAERLKKSCEEMKRFLGADKVLDIFLGQIVAYLDQGQTSSFKFANKN